MAAFTKNGDSGQWGYTLIEMLIVISIIGILINLSVPNWQRAIIRAREASLKNTLFVLRNVIDQYYADHGKYPESFDELAEKKYIREAPKDPITRRSDSWIIIPPEDEEEEGMIYDIHSGSLLVGLDGVPYNEW